MVYYVAFYNPKEEEGLRVANYAGEDKIDYICEVLNQMNERVVILSNTKSIKKQYLKKTKYVRSSKKAIIMFASLSCSNTLMHVIDVLFGFIQLAIYLLHNVKKGDIVLVYHSLGYRKFFNFFRKIKNFKYLLEVEELFQYIDCANSFKKHENKIFSEPDAFIFSNNILEKKVNVNNKPMAVINGIYKNEKRICEVTKSEKIKVVYAGSLEIQKGVDFVIRAAEYLDEQYEMKIIGFGRKEDITRVSDLIAEVQVRTNCKITYDGTYKGTAYLSYVQSCDIGVCVQDPEDIFNLYEFPSKIFSYMSNGLRVVVNELEQIKKSEIAKYLTIAEGIEPLQIASAIIDASNIQIDASDILSKLNDRFLNKLKDIMNEIREEQ